MTNMEFQDKVVLITGGSSGLGASTAIYFASQAAKLALVGRNEANLNKIASYCQKAKGVKPHTIIADVTKDEDLTHIIDEAIECYGKIDVLVNGAGIFGMGGMKDSSISTYDQVMATNMRAVYHLTMLATPHLVKSKGCIVNVSSITSTKPNALSIAYNISKAALDQFTKCVALELAGDGVRVNSVNPGFVKTNLLKGSGLTEDQLELLVKNMMVNSPIQKSVQTTEVAALIGYLASEKASSITGSCFVIDCGASLK